MTHPASRSIRSLLALILVLSAYNAIGSPSLQGQLASNMQHTAEEGMLVQYLEIVTPDVEATCTALEQLHGVRFGEAIAEFGNARTAALEGGGLISVRAPLRPDEDPVVRPYVMVDDIEAAVEAAKAAGSEIAIPFMEIPGRGKIAIYIQGGIQHGLWQK